MFADSRPGSVWFAEFPRDTTAVFVVVWCWAHAALSGVRSPWSRSIADRQSPRQFSQCRPAAESDTCHRKWRSDISTSRRSLRKSVTPAVTPPTARTIPGTVIGADAKSPIVVTRPPMSTLASDRERSSRLDVFALREIPANAGLITSFLTASATC